MTVLETFLHDPTADFIGKKVDTPSMKAFSMLIFVSCSVAPISMFLTLLRAFLKMFGINFVVYSPGNQFHCQ